MWHFQKFAQLLEKELNAICAIPTELIKISLDKTAPLKPVKAKDKSKKEEPESDMKSSCEEKDKYKKVPCNLCGRQMANEFVLQYHVVRSYFLLKRGGVAPLVTARTNH
mgnify:CR=1 FL=1